MVHEKFINKINLDDLPCESVIIQTEWCSSHVEISLLLSTKETSGTACQPQGFVGEITIEDLRKPADDLGIPFHVFLGETKRALTTENGIPGFAYKCDMKTFKWKKGPIIYGAVKLTPNKKLCLELLLNSTKVIADLHEQNRKLRVDLESSQENYLQIKNVLTRHVDEKQANKNTTLTKFTAMLNEKKRKIRELEDQLSNGNVKSNGLSTRKRSSPVPNGFFDNEENGTVSPPKRKPQERQQQFECQPSTSTFDLGSSTALLPQRKKATASNEPSPSKSDSVAPNVDVVIPEPEPIAQIEAPIEPTSTAGPSASVSKSKAEKQAAAMKQALEMLSQIETKTQSIYDCETEELLEQL